MSSDTGSLILRGGKEEGGVGFGAVGLGSLGVVVVSNKTGQSPSDASPTPFLLLSHLTHLHVSVRADRGAQAQLAVNSLTL